MAATEPSRISLKDAAPVVFVNIRAGRGRAGRHAPRVQSFLQQQGIHATFVRTASREELQYRAAEAIKEGCRTLLAMGGDGTVQGLVQAALGRDVAVGVLPAGGGNDFAAALGLPLNPLPAAKCLLAGEGRRIDIARARTSDGSERIYLGGGGIGLDAEAALYAANHYRHLPGRMRYVASALHALRRFKPLRVKATFPGSDLPEMEAPLLLACVLNTPAYGAGLRLAPAARIDDGLLDATLVESLGMTQVLALLPRLISKGEINTPGMKRIRCARVRLTPDRSCVFHGDGEIFGPAPVEVEILPGAVSFLTSRAH